MRDRERSFGLDQLGQVETIDIFHREDDALAQAAGGICCNNVGVVQPGRVADFTQKVLHHPAPLGQVAANDLQDFMSAHEPVFGEIDRPHTPLTKLADNLVVGVVRQSRRQGVGGRRCR